MAWLALATTVDQELNEREGNVKDVVGPGLRRHSLIAKTFNQQTRLFNRSVLLICCPLLFPPTGLDYISYTVSALLFNSCVGNGSDKLS